MRFLHFSPPLLVALALLTGLSAPSSALAAAGCWESGVCVAAPAVGPCDDTCGFCIDDVCVRPDACLLPCEVGGGCPTLRLGNQVTTVSGVTAECSYEITGCEPLVVRATSVTPPSGCRAPGAEPTVAGFFGGDCDEDGILNGAEGSGGVCAPQQYARPSDPNPLGTCNPDGCVAGCRGFPPHGGSVCTGSGAAGYRCGTVSECPSTPDRPARTCLSLASFDGRGDGLCLYDDSCGGDAAACFDFTAADRTMWLESAFLLGDCDQDGVLNESDGSLCGDRLVRWEGASPSPQPGPHCGDANPCTFGECSALGLCAGPAAIGLECSPAATDPAGACTAALGTPAECVYAGTTDLDAIGICIPLPAGTLENCTPPIYGSSCFLRGTVPPTDPVDSFRLGDCDGDGLTNDVDPDVCRPAVATDDAGPVDAGPIDAGPTDAGPIDARSVEGEDAGGPSRFAGSGCSCRVTSREAPRPAWLLLAGVVLALGRRRARR